MQHLIQFIQEPRDSHYQVALHVSRYLVGYPISIDLLVKANSNVDWETCKFHVGSLIGYCVSFGSSLVSWKTKKQKIVAKSSAKVEYNVMSTTISEIKHISHCIHDLYIPLHCILSCIMIIKPHDM